MNRPSFYGATLPSAAVTVYARPRGSGVVPVAIGRGTADANGVWRVQSVPLPDGAYAIFVAADAGVPALNPILPEINRGVIVIDTVGPRVTDARFLPLAGRVQTTFQDVRSGLAQAGLADPANYSLVRERTATGARNPRNAPRFAASGVATTAGPDLAAAQVVEVVIDDNRKIAGGFFRYAVRAQGNTDVAGNPLAGSFGGSFPTGGAAGADFTAELISFRRRVLPVLPAAASVANLTPAGQRQLGSIIAAVDSGRLTPERAATRISALPRRAVPVVNAAKPTARVADRLLRRGGPAGN